MADQQYYSQTVSPTGQQLYTQSSGPITAPTTQPSAPATSAPATTSTSTPTLYGWTKEDVPFPNQNQITRTDSSGAPIIGTGGPYNAAASAYYSGLDRSKPDENQIREDMRRQVQAGIDLINTTYTGIISRAQQQGTENLGQGRAINARSGLLGSDFGNAAQDKIQQNTNNEVNAYMKERDAKIGALLSNADERADAKIEAEKNRALTNSKDYLAFLKDSQESARTDVVNFAKGGHSLKDLSDADYKKLLDQTGYSATQLDAIIAINKPQKQTLTSFTQGSTYYVVSKDPITGKTQTDKIDLGVTIPHNWESQKVGDNSVIFFDPQNPKKNFTYTVPNSGTDDITKDLQDAAAAITAGADAVKVRQRFLDAHPTKGDLYLKYTNQAY